MANMADIKNSLTLRSLPAAQPPITHQPFPQGLARTRVRAARREGGGGTGTLLLASLSHPRWHQRHSASAANQTPCIHDFPPSLLLLNSQSNLDAFIIILIPPLVLTDSILPIGQNHCHTCRDHVLRSFLWLLFNIEFQQYLQWHACLIIQI